MNKKTNFSKTVLLLISISLILCFAIGGTVAYLIDISSPVENTFNPARVPISVTDEIDNNVKKNVVITNTGNVSAYIRVAVIANWYKDGKIVEPCDVSGIKASDFGDNWVKGSDGFFYYTLPVAAEAKAINSFSYTAGTSPIDGAHLEMTIAAQSIQSTPAEAVGEAWGVVISQNSVTAYPQSN